ncbi:MAG: YggT family protein [candidate division Zixibacteria bacterium]|nr:YggT family protein [candidate division Zixibacteria bacterium]
MILLRLLRIYLLLIMLRAILSWFKPDPSAPLMRLLTWLTNPALLPFQRLLPPIPLPGTNTRIDLAPVVVLLIGGWLLAKIR